MIGQYREYTIETALAVISMHHEGKWAKTPQNMTSWLSMYGKIIFASCVLQPLHLLPIAPIHLLPIFCFFLAGSRSARHSCC